MEKQRSIEKLARKAYEVAKISYPTPLPPFHKLEPAIKEAWLMAIRNWIEHDERAKE